MNGNGSDVSLRSECSSDSEEGTFKVVSQGNSIYNEALEHENCNPKTDCGLDNSIQSGEEDERSLGRTKRRIQFLSDSDEETATDTVNGIQIQNNLPSENDSKSPNKYSSDDTGTKRHKINLKKSRLRKISTSGEESDSNSNKNTSSNDELESRIKNKRNKLRQKFQNLHNKKNKKSSAGSENDQRNKLDEENSPDSYSSNNEASVENIKKIIRQETMIKSSLYDPDTSDEESNVPNKTTALQKKGKKSTKLTSPKPLRMSAKQAMENMQKIKSESNRMLREKDVSLPYHRPKALNLKDIMSRRRAAVTPDGRALPIKMNDEQLKQYAQILEQRQKEVIELCKSDTEEEEEEEVKRTKNNTEDLPDTALLNDTLYDDLSKTECQNSKDICTNLDNMNSVNSPNLSMINTVNSNIEQNSSRDDTNVNRDILTTEAKIINVNINELNPETDEPMSIDMISEQSTSKENQSNTIDENNSMEMELVYNDSVEDNSTENANVTEEVSTNLAKPSSEVGSQLICLHFDTEKSDNNTEHVDNVENIEKVQISEEMIAGPSKNSDEVEINEQKVQNTDFSDDDMNMEDIDALIEKAEITLSQSKTKDVNSPMLIKEPLSLTGKPKLTGTPGMVIDLDGITCGLKKLSGVELLKERFVYFSKLKTPEELERENEKRIKPGMQHLKLKLELEEQIAEQRSLEWAKRLEEEKQHRKELNALRGEGSDAEEDIDAIEAKLEEKEDAIERESSSESEEEHEELDQDIVDKPRKRNPMVDDEAEESDCDNEESEDGKNDIEQNKMNENGECNVNDDADDENDEDEEESSEESDDSEDDEQNKPKKGRILKAFEDSDDEGAAKIEDNNQVNENIESNKDISPVTESPVTKNTQDDELHLAQKSITEDLFTSQESSTVNSDKGKLIGNVPNDSFEEKQLGTQTFSILEPAKENADVDFPMPDTLSIPRDTQSYDDSLDAVVGMCSGSFSQTQNLVPASQAIGEDVLALCTGQFYDNQFVSQEESKNTGKSEYTLSENNIIAKVNDDIDTENEVSKSVQDYLVDMTGIENSMEQVQTKISKTDNNEENIGKKKSLEDPNLKSILDELNDPEFDSPKPNKYFVSNDSQNKENKQSIANAQFKKKLIIDSDEEDKGEDTNVKKKKKLKKKKMEQRALQISDDEDDVQDEAEEYESELEEEDRDRIVEYDSEENEVIVEQHQPKKKRKLGEFFEQEAELTSEDEWVGSGDEDEAGLDRMEREEGDDDTFNEKKLQRELGQIHMRDVLDQDKREVRLIQELLFEDADLGGGSRQRKFRWRNADGEEETGTINDEFADTQEEEFESEEQWRKQRHEREMFLKSLINQEEPEEALNVSVNRTSIIKANLSKNNSIFFDEVNRSIEELDTSVPEKKTATAKDIPSPKKPFTIFQQNYHGSLLTRGRGALARLAALATPLTNDDDTPKVGSLKPTSKRNFVFASIDAPTPDEDEPKVTKRKAEGNAGTPRLVKKLRTEDKQQYSKPSLLDHMKI